MPSVSIAGEVFGYAEKGQGRPVLFVHGFPLDRTLWDEQLGGLTECGRLIAPDLRGFGESRAARTANLSIEQFADDLAHLLDALRIAEPVVFCGLSMGGYIAFEFWRKHADRVRGLVLCGSMLYSAVIHPWPRPSSHSGTFGSTLAVHSTTVRPASISTLPGDIRV